MGTSKIANLYANLEDRTDINDYNFNHFRTVHLLKDIQRTIVKQGIEPGSLAPDFELPFADQAFGESLRLSELRGRPVVLHFGSLT